MSIREVSTCEVSSRLQAVNESSSIITKGRYPDGASGCKERALAEVEVANRLLVTVGDGVSGDSYWWPKGVLIIGLAGDDW